MRTIEGSGANPGMIGFRSICAILVRPRPPKPVFKIDDFKKDIQYLHSVEKLMICIGAIVPVVLVACKANQISLPRKSGLLGHI